MAEKGQSLPSLENHREMATELLRAARAGEPRAASRFVNYHPRGRGLDDGQVAGRDWQLSDAQLVVAREARFDSWPLLERYIEEVATSARPGSADGGAAARFEAAADMTVHGDLVGLAAALDEDPELIRARSPRPHGGTLLHYSASNGVEDHRQRVPPNAVAVADLLIGRGADINAESAAYGGGPGSTPLVALVTSGHPTAAGLMEDMVRAYAGSGQNLDGTEDDGLPLAYAFLFRNVSAAETLAECGARIDNAAAAAGLGDVERLAGMVDPGPPPTANPATLPRVPWLARDGESAAAFALYLACIGGQKDAAQWLVTAGVDVNRRVRHGMTALHEACFGGHVALVRLLVEAGADVDAVEEQHGSNPLGWAAHAGHHEVVRYLKRTGTGRNG